MKEQRVRQFLAGRLRKTNRFYCYAYILDRVLQRTARRINPVKPADRMTDEGLQKVWLKKNEREDYQAQVQTSAKLHENSLELVDFVTANNIISSHDILTHHELGCGCGRNLGHLQRAFPDAEFSGNDLCRKACYTYIDEAIKANLNFWEYDTYAFLKSEVDRGAEADILLASDHLMHLSRHIIEDVYRLMSKFARAGIVLREPWGSRVSLNYGGGKYPFLWAADRFVGKFPGFNLEIYQRCKNAVVGNEYTLMWLKRDA